MNPVYVIGSGGREFELARKLHEEGMDVSAIPGNDGIRRLRIARTFPLPGGIKIDSAEGFKYISDIASSYNEKPLIVVGPEAPLIAGIGDAFDQEGYLVFGPKQSATWIEASKCKSSEFMRRNNIPVPAFYNPESYQDAISYVRRRKMPIVIKGDGLTQGTGVTVAEKLGDAEKALYIIMVEGKLGGPRANIQDFIDISYEISATAIVDVRRRNGTFTGSYRLLPYSIDHKTLYANRGPNTGGMGAAAPLPLTESMKKRIVSTIIEPTIEGFVKEGIEFTGFLYPAIAVDKEGNLWVFEYNIRLGDPEAQVVLDRVESLHHYLMAAYVGELDRMPEIKPKEGYSIIVNLVSRGYPYPEKLETGFAIEGLDETGQLSESAGGVTVIHAGTRYIDGKEWITSGGRVLGVRAGERQLHSAIGTCYQNVKKVNFKGMHYRRDIARKALRLVT